MTVISSYAIYRQPRPANQHGTTWVQSVCVCRQGRPVTRTFSELACGGEQATRLMAQAYRDALIHMLPPQTQRERSTRLQQRNTSGISGVFRTGNSDSGSAAWIASFTTEKRKRARTFSIARYGEDEAKVKAIAAREKLLAAHPNYFMTADAGATQAAEHRFGELLHPNLSVEPFVTMAPATVEFLIEELNAWFDTLRPLHVKVYVAVSYGARRQMTIIVSDGGLPARAHKKGLSLDVQNVQAALPAAWRFVQESLTALHGRACWKQFSARYKASFFTYEGDEAFKIAYRYDAPSRRGLLQPPATLVPHLKGFMVPRNL